MSTCTLKLENGYSQKVIPQLLAQSISKAPHNIFKLMDNLRNEVSILRDTLRRYGLLDSDEMYDTWIKNRLSKVDKEFPLIDEKND